MTVRTLVGPVVISGGTPLASARITLRPIPELPYDATYLSPALVTYYVVDGAIHGDADGQDDALVSSPLNGEWSVYIGRNRVHRFIGSVAESSDDVAFSDIYATSRSTVTTDPWLVREGDDVTRLGSGDAANGQIPAADGVGGVAWADPPEGTGGGGVSDHGALTGLSDDDHPQYHNNARGDARYTPTSTLTGQLAAKADLVGGKVPSSQIPAVSIGETFSVASQAAMLALTAQQGDVAIRTDLSNAKHLLLGTDPTVLSNWVSMAASGGAVDSVNGQTGAVVLGASDVGAAAASHSHSNATTSTAGFESAADKTKLDGIATGATANQTDAYLLSRANHTGMQAISTITDLQAIIDGLAPSNVIYVDAQTGPTPGEKIQQAINAAEAVTPRGIVNIRLGRDVYDISDVTFDTTTKAQIVFPSINPFTEGELFLIFTGEGHPPPVYSVITGNAHSIPTQGGTVILSTATPAGTGYSMFGGKGPTTLAGGFEELTHVRVHINGITLRTANNDTTGSELDTGEATPANITAFDGSHLWGLTETDNMVDTGISCARYFDSGMTPGSGTYGFIFPKGSNAGMQYTSRSLVIGYETGYKGPEHINGDISCMYCINAFEAGDDGGGSAVPGHGSVFSRIWDQNCANTIKAVGPMMIKAHIDRELYDGSAGAKYFTPVAFVSDTDNLLWGDITVNAAIGTSLMCIGARHVKVNWLQPLKFNHADSVKSAGAGTLTLFSDGAQVHGKSYVYVSGNATTQFQIRWPGGVAVSVQPGSTWKLTVICMTDSDGAKLTFAPQSSLSRPAQPSMDFSSSTVKNNVILESKPFVVKHNDPVLDLAMNYTAVGDANTSGYFAAYITEFVLTRLD